MLIMATWNDRRFYVLLSWVMIGLIHGQTQASSGVRSAFTDKVLALSRSSSTLDVVDSRGKDQALKLRAFEVVKGSLYLGLEQQQVITAPLSAVAAVLDNVDQYVELFEGFASVRRVKESETQWVLAWEQTIPIFFLPNEKYETYYFVDQPTPLRKVYRYQLKQQDGRIRFNDGLIVLEALDSQRTLYTEVDYVDADWGPLKVLGDSRIWKESVEGLALSDFAIRLKSEHLDWSYSKVRSEARSLLKLSPVDRVVEERTRL